VVVNQLAGPSKKIKGLPGSPDGRRKRKMIVHSQTILGGHVYSSEKITAKEKISALKGEEQTGQDIL